MTDEPIDWTEWSREAVAEMQARNQRWLARFSLDGAPYRWDLDSATLTFTRAGGRVVFLTACLLSVAPQAIGAFFYSGYSDNVICCPVGERRFAAAWDPRNTPFILELRYPRPTMQIARLIVDHVGRHWGARRARSR